MIITAIIVLLLLVPVMAAVVMKDSYSISSGVEINRARHDIYSFVKFLRNADRFNKWMMADPGSRKEFVGTDGTPGFIYKWDSDQKNLGKGEQEITGLTENERIDYEIRFIKPFEGISFASIRLADASAGATAVIWTFSGKRNFAMRIFHFLFNLKKVLKKDLHTSLVNLKSILENG